jgi:enolase-phosphatase E1
MIRFLVRGVLLDIEGTTSSISFVYDTMFPFVRRELERYLKEHWAESGLSLACDRIALDAGYESLEAWVKASAEGSEDAFLPQAQSIHDDPVCIQKLVAAEVIRLMDQDVKATGLKQLQGLVWQDGFSRGELISHVYDDVLPAIRHWRSENIAIRIYSSGSVQAQKLFFGHTAVGNLLSYFSGHDDTTIGAKKEAESYRRIATAFGYSACDLLFLSDITAELDAAREAGFYTAHVIRDPDFQIEESMNALGSKGTISHPIIRSFDQIHLSNAALPL